MTCRSLGSVVGAGMEMSLKLFGVKKKKTVLYPDSLGAYCVNKHTDFKEFIKLNDY